MKAWRVLGTPWLLEQWSHWVGIPDKARLGYPQKSNFVKYQGGSISLPQIDDDTAIILDLGIKAMGERYPDYEQAILSTYLYRDNISLMSDRLEVDRRKGKTILDCAHAWLDCWLHQKLDDKVA